MSDRYPENPLAGLSRLQRQAKSDHALLNLSVRILEDHKVRISRVLELSAQVFREPAQTADPPLRAAAPKAHSPRVTATDKTAKAKSATPARASRKKQRTMTPAAGPRLPSPGTMEDTVLRAAALLPSAEPINIGQVHAALVEAGGYAESRSRSYTGSVTANLATRGLLDRAPEPASFAVPEFVVAHYAATPALSAASPPPVLPESGYTPRSGSMAALVMSVMGAQSGPMRTSDVAAALVATAPSTPVGLPTLRSTMARLVSRGWLRRTGVPGQYERVVQAATPMTEGAAEAPEPSVGRRKGRRRVRA